MSYKPCDDFTLLSRTVHASACKCVCVCTCVVSVCACVYVCVCVCVCVCMYAQRYICVSASCHSALNSIIFCHTHIHTAKQNKINHQFLGFLTLFIFFFNSLNVIIIYYSRKGIAVRLASTCGRQRNLTTLTMWKHGNRLCAQQFSKQTQSLTIITCWRPWKNTQFVIVYTW